MLECTGSEGAGSEPHLSQVLSDMRQLHAVSTRLIVEDDIDALYHAILDGATALMRTKMGTMQLLDRERGKLHLLCSLGFDGEWDTFYEWVGANSSSGCAEALRTGTARWSPTPKDAHS